MTDTRIPSLGPRGEGWVAIQAVLFVALGATAVLAPGRLEGLTSGAVVVLGCLAIAAGGILVGGGLLGLRRGSALTALPHPRGGAELVTNGLYGWVRHPVYGGLVVAAIGLALLRVSVATGMVAIALLVFFDLKRRREEAWLVARFPGYAAYRARTRRLIPWLY